MQLAKFVTLAALVALALPAAAQTVSQGTPRIDPQTQDQPTKKGDKPSKKTDRTRQDQNTK